MSELTTSLLRTSWWITSFFNKHKIVIIIGIVAGVLVVANSARILSLLPSKQVRYVARVGAFGLSELPLDIQEQVGRGLMEIGPDDKPLPDLASDYQVSADGKTYTFTLKDNLTWSDGAPLTAHDINVQLNEVKKNVLSDRQISFELKEAYAPFPVIVSQPLLKRSTTGRLRKRTIIIGTKELYISKVEFDGQYLSSLTLDSPTQEIRYRFYPTEQDAVTAFKLGKVDEIEKVNNPYLTSWPNVSVTEEASTKRYLTLLFNTSDDQLKQKSIRQLLTYATPKKSDAFRVISPIAKNSWVYNPQVKRYDHSIETAQRMLDKAKEGSSSFTLDITLTTTPAYADMANLIVDSWRQIGVEARLRVVPAPDTNDYQILLIGQQIPDDPDQYLLWHSTQATNITHYQSPKIDKLLEDGRKELDSEKRKTLYQEFQRFLVEDSPAAFLHQLQTYTIKRI